MRQDGSPVPAEATYSKGSGFREVALTLGRALEAQSPVRVTLGTLPPGGDEANPGGFWRVETRSGGVVTNTNDGQAPELPTAAVLQVVIDVTRTPPGALVDLTVRLLHVPVDVTGLRLLAPLGFQFPSSPICGTGCVSSEPTRDGRPTAVVALLADRTEDAVLVRCTTPQQPPSDLSWFVEARGLHGLSGPRDD